MALRTATIYPSSDPSVIMGHVGAGNGDTWTIPYGVLESCIVNSEDDDDAIATASVSGSIVTLGLTDDAGADVSGTPDINFIARLRNQ